MTKQLPSLLVAILLLFGSNILAASKNENLSTEVHAITEFNANQYLGKWYEIARLPNIFQSQCVSDISAYYVLKDENIEVTNRCRKADRNFDEAIGIAYPQNAIKSKLKVSFLPKYLRWIPFTKGDYWILKIDPQYQVALVGDPSRKYLWLLSRTPTLSDDVITSFLDTAKEQGYRQLDQLIYTKNEVQ